MSEVWKEVPFYLGRYEVSNLGRMRSLIGTPKFLKFKTDKDGYKQATLSLHAKVKYLRVHRVVFESFGEVVLNNNLDVHHINGVKDDNRIENLSVVVRTMHKGTVMCPHCNKRFDVK